MCVSDAARVADSFEFDSIDSNNLGMYEPDSLLPDFYIFFIYIRKVYPPNIYLM